MKIKGNEITVKSISVLLLFATGFFVFACSDSDEDNIVNVYSHRHYDIDKQLFKEFTDKTGIPGAELGPLLDLAGNAVGIFIDRRGAMAALGIERKVPLTENFAVGTKVIRAFLDAHNVRYRTANPSAPLAAADLADKAYNFTVKVTCWD